MPILFLIFLNLVLSGCLQTRADLKEAETAVVMREQVSSLQKVHADSSTRLDELLEQNRNLSGRIEELEYRLKKSDEERGAGREGTQKVLDETKRQNELLQESIVKMEAQLQALQEEIISLKSHDKVRGSKHEDNKNTEKSSELSKAKEKKDKDKQLFDMAIANFQEKKWKEAILNFDQYREKNPKGKFAAEATYKTGVCFQELGMSDEARVFYQDVVAKFPQSDMAKRAQTRLKSLK